MDARSSIDRAALRALQLWTLRLDPILGRRLKVSEHTRQSHAPLPPGLRCFPITQQLQLYADTLDDFGPVAFAALAEQAHGRIPW